MNDLVTLKPLCSSDIITSLIGLSPTAVILKYMPYVINISLDANMNPLCKM
jgi:hypothetical protein